MAALSNKVRFEVFKRDGFTCQYCGGKAPDVVLHVDHIHPRSRGGRDDLGNLITACSRCNSGKRDVSVLCNGCSASQNAQVEQELTELLVEMVGWLVRYREEQEAIDDAKAGNRFCLIPVGKILPEQIRCRHEWPDNDENLVNWGYKLAIRMIGYGLHAAGGMEAMTRAADAVLTAHGGKGISPVDSAWDDIGGWVS